MSKKWQVILASLLLFAAVLVGPGRAGADPGCQSKGFYVLFARGSGANIGSSEEKQFTSVGDELRGANWQWGELGNLDNDGQINSQYEYPAVINAAWAAYQTNDGNWQFPGYLASVRTGVKELIKHLNQRYGNGPGDRNCSTETLILGGYSQGADVIGWALEENPGGDVGKLSATARRHVGSVALYGDPHYVGNFGSGLGGCFQPPWAMINNGCPNHADVGLLGARSPYVPTDIGHRVMSYCANGDGMCHGSPLELIPGFGTHTTAYSDAHGHIAGSTPRLAAVAFTKRSQLNPSIPLPGFAIELPLLNVPSPPVQLPPPDSDHDGTPDPQDPCPHVYVAANSGCPAKGDFSLDGKSDVPAFYRYDGQAVNLWVWNGQSDLHTSGPYAPWGTETGWEGQRLIPAGTGDFNGDRLQDIASFYSYDGGAMGITVMYGNNQGGLSPFSSWYANSGWEKDRVIPAGAGDFNNDGRGDVAAFYRYDDHLSLYVWYGQENMQLSGPHSVWWANDWDGSRVIPVGAGDVDGDGNLDVSTFYRHDGGMVDHNVWYGDGSGGFTLGRPWHTPSGWDGSRLIPGGVTDLNGDGRADTIAFFRHDNNVVDMRSWWGTASRSLPGEPGSPWSGSGWDGSRILPAGTGDYNGDGKNDIASFYRYDGQEIGLTIWYGTGTGYLNPFTGWHVTTAWEGERLVATSK